MNDLHLSALATHVVAWHNRHLLARRIGVAQVDSMGYVALPFVVSGSAAGHRAQQMVEAEAEVEADATTPATPGATLRERAMARAQQASADSPPAPITTPAAPHATQPARADQLRAAFTEDFMPRRSPAQVAQWVAQHGVALASEPGDAPVRKLKVHPGADAARLQLRWVLTAQVYVDGKRTRLLVGAGARPAVLGQRLWSPVRLGLMALGLAGCAGLLARLVSASPAAVIAPASVASALAPAPAPAPVPAPAPATATATSPAPTSAATSASTPVASAAPVAEAASLAVAAVQPIASASASAPAATQAQPVDAQPTLGRVTLPSLSPGIERRRQAASQAAATPPAALATTAVFAVATRPLRTRTEAEQLAAAMRVLLVSADAPKLHVDILPAGDDWRVVGLPYSSPLAADKARAVLAARGMKVQVVEF